MHRSQNIQYQLDMTAEVKSLTAGTSMDTIFELDTTLILDCGKLWETT